MKKVSTVAAKQSKNISQPKLTIGLDLGDRNSWYCVLDESGQIQQEQRVRTNAKALREVFGAMPHSRIALEIGTHSPWSGLRSQTLGLKLAERGGRNGKKRAIIATARKLAVLLHHLWVSGSIRTVAQQPAPVDGARSIKTKTSLGKENQKPKAEFR